VIFVFCKSDRSWIAGIFCANKVFAKYRYSLREKPLALPVDRANDATASTPRKPRGIPENSGDDDEKTIVYYLEGVRENVHEDTDWERQGHGSNGQLGYPWFALANGRENDVDPSGHKTSGKSSLRKISSILRFATLLIGEILASFTHSSNIYQ